VTGSARATRDWVPYAGAIAVTGVALWVRFLFGAALVGTPYLPVYFAVLIAARYWGLGPSTLVTALGAIGCTILPPAVAPYRAIVFLVLAALLIWIVEIFRSARADAERHAQVAEERMEQLRKEVAQRADDERRSAQLRAIVESSEDSIISKDLDGVIQSWNRGAEQVFGYTAAEAIGQNMSILLQPDRVHEESEIIERIRRGGRVKHFETIRLHKSGKPIHVSLMVSPIRGPDGAIVGASQIARDITERKEFEEQIRQTQRLESLRVLAGGLAHDFNNLLTGIMGNASLALSELDRPAKAQARLEEVLQGSERAALLVRQMLAYAGKGRFLLEKLDLSAQVREIVPLLRTSVSKLVDLQMQLADELPLVEGDRAQIQQLIMNLALNGAEAIVDRPGTVTVRTWQQTIDTERQVILEVRDTGVGMSEEVKSRIFDPFFSTKFTGRGLGLSAVMGIIKAHCGTITVASTPGRGTTMTAVFPAIPGGFEPKTASEEETLVGNGLVLIVDDEDLVRNMAKFTLERYGYSIDTAADGQEAVAKFGARPREFAAILLDLTMPVMHGEDALIAIRHIRPDVPVVISSGYTETEALGRFNDLGVKGFLQKPYTATGLARKIKNAMGNHAG
jgi:PAS domain S-box-containing protein